jgi:hypothetical protein
MEGSHGGVQNPNSFSENDAEYVKIFGKNSKKNGSEIFMLKTLKCYNSMNITQIAFGVVRNDF